MTREIDTARLVRDLRWAARECELPEPSLGRASYYHVRGMGRAFGVVAAMIEDGDYDPEPSFDIVGATTRIRGWLGWHRDH